MRNCTQPRPADHNSVSRFSKILCSMSKFLLLKHVFSLTNDLERYFYLKKSCDIVKISYHILFSFQKSAVKPLQAPQAYSAAPPYIGSNAPPSIYLGVPPYGSSLFNGSPVPPYEVPFSGGSAAYHYNYGGRLSAGSPYRPLHLAGPAPYASGSMVGNGLFCFPFSCHSNS